jgi:Fe-S cluster biogenesis protein NfuA
MFIQTETTPNPATLKFIPGEAVLENSTANFNNKEDAAKSPLALSLFDVKGVEAVFLGSDFISVTKSSEHDWGHLKTEVLTTIMEHFVSGKAIMAQANKSVETNEDEDEVVKQIRELIDTRVRPSVAQDGGDIVFHGFENGVVKLQMHGSCSGCPSSAITLKNGIENMLKHYIPEVESVEAVEV